MTVSGCLTHRFDGYERAPRENLYAQQNHSYRHKKNGHPKPRSVSFLLIPIFFSAFQPGFHASPHIALSVKVPPGYFNTASTIPFARGYQRISSPVLRRFGTLSAIKRGKEGQQRSLSRRFETTSSGVIVLPRLLRSSKESHLPDNNR